MCIRDSVQTHTKIIATLSVTDRRSFMTKVFISERSIFSRSKKQICSMEHHFHSNRKNVGCFFLSVEFRNNVRTCTRSSDFTGHGWKTQTISKFTRNWGSCESKMAGYCPVTLCSYLFRDRSAFRSLSIIPI